MDLIPVPEDTTHGQYSQFLIVNLLLIFCPVQDKVLSCLQHLYLSNHLSVQLSYLINENFFVQWTVFNAKTHNDQIAENRPNRVFGCRPDIIPIPKAKEPSVRREHMLGRNQQKDLEETEIMEDQSEHCLLGLRGPLHSPSHSSCGCLRKTHPRSSQSPFQRGQEAVHEPHPS